MTTKVPFKIIKIDHIAVATKKNYFKEFLQNTLGLGSQAPETISSQGVTVQELFACDGPTIEILNPLEDNSSLRKFTDSKKGVHHISLQVDNINLAFNYLQKKQIQLISTKIEKGKNNSKIIFIHPKESDGILIELVEL
jgi:methylmalonyl-CoA/ethylmalonyl-CoA epimerase